MYIAALAQFQKNDYLFYTSCALVTGVGILLAAHAKYQYTQRTHQRLHTELSHTFYELWNHMRHIKPETLATNKIQKTLNCRIFPSQAPQTSQEKKAVASYIKAVQSTLQETLNDTESCAVSTKDKEYLEQATHKIQYLQHQLNKF